MGALYSPGAMPLYWFDDIEILRLDLVSHESLGLMRPQIYEDEEILVSFGGDSMLRDGIERSVRALWKLVDLRPKFQKTLFCKQNTTYFAELQCINALSMPFGIL